MGAAGRDFHDFLTVFKDDPDYKVVAFTAEQIPGISGRVFPRKLAGSRYPKGIPIYPERNLVKIIKKEKVDECVLSYSDLNHIDVMHKASRVLAAGANFRLLSYEQTALKSNKPVISVCAVRTGCGKSQVARKISLLLKEAGKKVVVIRHPMPYGDLAKQEVQRFETYKDLKNCTIEEREEYEPHIRNDIVVFAGIDSQEVLLQAESEADVIIWDGGNNDVPFFKSDLHIVVVDPLRPGNEMMYHPGEENLRLADVVIINKMDSAKKINVDEVLKNIHKIEQETGKKIIIKAESDIKVDRPGLIWRSDVLVIEDGPTLTHGDMRIGAGQVAAKRLKGRIVEPAPYAVGSIKEVYKKYPSLRQILPAMGYSKKQINELRKTIKNVPCDAVVDGSPFDIARLLKMDKPVADVTYELKEIGRPNLRTVLKKKRYI